MKRPVFTYSLRLSFLIYMVATSAPYGIAQVVYQAPRPASESGTNPSAKDSWFLRGRTSARESTAMLRYLALQHKARLRTARRSQAIRASTDNFGSSGLSWIPLGPAPLGSDASGDGQQDYNWVSGRATSIAIDPADSTGNTVYLGGAYGGVWKSTNAGPLSTNPANVIWTPVTDNQATLAVGAIAIQPQLNSPDPTKSVILVGTGEANSSLDSYYGLGILRSANAGNTWTLIPADSSGARSFAGMGFSKIAFSTALVNQVAAATASTAEGIANGLENPVQTNLGLYGSRDGGQSWTYASVADSGVTVSPGSATTVVYNAAAGKFFATLRYHGFYSSSDGISWTRLSSQPGAGLTTTACPSQAVSPSSCPIYRGEITVTPGRNEMYAWYVDSDSNDQGIWLSTNGGISWTQLNEDGITNCGDEFGCGTDQGTYNLALLAVPDGSATDLYAGAINLYKCMITVNSPTCNGTGSQTFLNLTHVYGCPPDFGSIAHVHPAQHALASLLLNQSSQDVMYFANDGGIYRALNAYTGLTSGTCGAPNSFDSLNQTLGSMTQLVSFAQAAADPDVLLAGSDANGAPATASVLLSSMWQSVNYGDNGFTLISPTDENQWYVSNPPDSFSGVNIFGCSSGIGCHFQDFQSNAVVTGSSVGGDAGAYYTPYIFDPANNTAMLVGTCRLWRGPPGGTFTVLSHSFETGGDGICTGDEVNLVRSIAAGGALDNNGNSNVIYAGTDGFGPLVPTTPPGGHVWVSTNVAGGTSTWTDRTGSINPNSFPISGIAIDPSDVAGLTAYVAIMGFHTSHVWQTSNGGITWVDFTANLPDAPVNAILVDPGTVPSNGTVYVGTDVGVFSSSTASPSWAEVGPAPGSGQSGYLPNVAVTALHMFNTGTSKILRASTYGRGMWQFPLIITPDFAVTMTPSQQTVFGNQAATYDGLAIAFNGYSSQVNFTCTAGSTAPPSTCSTAPGSVTPSSSGTPFTLTASGADGDYAFNLHAVGADRGQSTHDYGLQLHVIDFALTPPSPAGVSVNEPGTSNASDFQVTAAGSFNAEVDLSCSGLPANTSCQFQPSSVVYPTSGNPVSITLRISASAGTATGTFPVTIVGATSGGPDQTRSLSLTVTDLADYVLNISDPISQTAPVNSVVSFKGTLTSLNDYASPVTLTCIADTTVPPPNCTPSPANLTPGTSGTAFTVAVKSGIVQTYHFDIAATGTDPSKIEHLFAVSFSTTFQFGITNQSGAQSIAAGQTATYDLDLAPTGSEFPKTVTLSCSGLPVESKCAFSPPQVATGSGETPVTFTVTTTAPVLADQRTKDTRGLIFYATWLPIAGVAFAWRSKRWRAHLAKSVLIAVLMIATMELSCGGGDSTGGGSSGSGSPGTPPGTYTLTVTATMGSLVNSTPVQLTIN